MTSTTPDPVVSGVPYVVRQVDDHEPRSIDDFVGSHSLVLAGRTGDHLVTGDGSRHDEAVRFHEKSTETSKDVRTWLVQAESGAYTATST